MWPSFIDVIGFCFNNTSWKEKNKDVFTCSSKRNPFEKDYFKKFSHVIKSTFIFNTIIASKSMYENRFDKTRIETHYGDVCYKLVLFRLRDDFKFNASRYFEESSSVLQRNSIAPKDINTNVVVQTQFVHPIISRSLFTTSYCLDLLSGGFSKFKQTSNLRLW